MTTNHVLIPLDGSALSQKILPHIQRLLQPATRPQSNSQRCDAPLLAVLCAVADPQQRLSQRKGSRAS
jgi:hypothetical protein